MRGIFTIVFVLLCCVFSSLTAQNCDPLSPPDQPAAGCACAFPDCSFGLNGFTGTLGTLNTAQAFPGCANNILNNDDWIAFIAGSTSIDITLNITNCQGSGANGGTGIQAAFYAACTDPINSTDEGTASQPLDTQCGCTTNNVNLNYNSFVIGQTYYIVIDGCGGDICDYSIIVNSGSTMVNDPGNISAISGTTTVCPGATETYTIDPLSGIVDYEWIVSAGGTIISENGNSITIQWNSSGSVSVSGSNACFTTNTADLPVTVQPLTPLTAEGEYCDNEAGYIYPANGQLYSAGFYMIDEVLTSGPNVGCTQTTNLTVTTNPTYFIDVSRTICEGESVTIGGVPYTIEGTYNINLTTQFTGCDSTIFLDLTVLNPLSIIMNPPDLGCTVDQVIINGALSEGDAYSWTTPDGGFICAGEFTPVMTACSPGTYCLEVTYFGVDGATGQPIECTDESCVVVEQDIDAPLLNFSSTDVSCGGSSDGTVSASVASGGVGPFIYIWNTNPTQSGQTITDLPSGSYSVTVTGSNGCTEEATVLVNEPTPVVADMSGTDASCNSGSEGSVSVLASGGSPGYTYEWNTIPAETGSTINNVPAGSYTVTVTDNNDCTVENTFTISEPTVLTLMESGSDALCNGGDEGEVSVVASGGTAPYSYLWDDANAQTSATATGLGAGTYMVIVTDDNDCTEMVSVTISEPTLLSVTISGTDPECNNSLDGDATVVASGGTAPYSYLWDDTNAQITPDASNLPAGTYTVVITDDNDCTTSASITLTAPNAISLSTTQVEVLCTGEGTGEATVIATGGTAPLSYLWDDMATQNTATAVGLEAGTYNVIVTDDNDCSETISVTITEPAEALGASGTSTDALCGQNNGTIDLTVTGGVGPYDFDWNGAAGNVEDPINLGPGSYTVVVTDANDCTTNATIIVNSPNSPSASVDVTDVTCNGETNGAMDITVTGGIAPYTFVWNPSSNDGNEDLLNTGAGSYSVTVTDMAGCSVVASGVVAQPDALSATATGSPADCGIDNGSVSVVVSGGIMPYSFDWPGTNNDGQQSPTGLAAGTYEVTITDDNGCTITASGDVIIPDGPMTTIVGTDVACNGGETGTIDISITGGEAPYTIVWNDPTYNGSENLIDLPAGTYDVVVTDVNNCSSVAGIEIIEPALLAVNTSTTPLTCFGSNDGTATANPVGGTAPYSFEWCDGQTGQTANNCIPGPCTVIITDSNGCTVETTVIIDEPSQVTVDALPSDADCNGTSTGSIEITANGGVGGYTYQWTNGIPNNTEDPSGLPAGDYEVTVSDANGCTVVVSSILISEPNAISLSFVTTEATCNASNGTANLTVTGGTAPYTYLWDDVLAQTTEDAVDLAAGVYIVEVTDMNGCTESIQVEILTPDALSINAVASPVDCNGASTGSIDVTLSGGVAPFTYQWDDGAAQTTEDAIDLPAGNYNVIVTDDNGCTITTSAIVDEPTIIQLSATSMDATCNQSNGSIDLTITGGTAPYTFDWSGTAPDQEDPSGLATGSYDLTVTDGNGCVAFLTQSVSTPSGLEISAIGNDANCFGENNGSIDLTVNGGTAPFTYQWDDAASQIIEDPVDLLAGDYSVTVTDGEGCTIVTSTTVNEPVILIANGTSSQATCSNANGSIDLTVTGGTAPYTYDWSGAAADIEDPQDLLTGTYDVVVTDANGCTTATSVLVNEPSALVLNNTPSDALCNGEASGSINLTVSGGAGPGTYMYQWDDAAAQTIEDPTGLAAGTYNVIVTDGNGCTITQSVLIGEPTALASSNTTIDALCGESDGSIDLTVTGGTAPYSYDWSGAVNDIEDPQGLPAGSYDVVITDANGCTLMSSATVNTPSMLMATTAPIDALCNGEASGSIDLTITGGTAPYDVSWSGGLGTVEDPSNVAANNYIATITDATGCEITAIASVGEPAVIALSSTSSQATCNNSNGSIDLTVSGGTAPYSFIWDDVNGQTIEDPINVAAGTYNVIVTDANGCTAEYSTGVSTPSALAIATTSEDALCNGDANGSVDVTVSGGTTPYSYDWGGGVTTEDLSGIGANTYTVIVTDGTGCTITTSVTINEPPVLEATNNAPSSVSCNGGNDGSATIVVVGGTSGYTYDWSDNAFDGNATPTNMSAGTYTVTVTDLNGCTDTEEVVIGEPSAIALSSASTPTLCFGSSEGTIDLTVSGGTAPYTYDWNNGTYTDQDPQGVLAGSYSVIVTDDNGCTAVESVQVSQPDAISVNIDNVSNYGGTNVSCADATDGSAEASVGAGGTAPFSYEWSNGSQIALAENLAAQDYFVTVTDGNGCTSIGSVSLDAPDAVLLNVDITNPDCYGENDGVILAEGSGGAGPYMYALDSDNFSAVNLYGGLTSGVYEVLVQDANGCEEVQEITMVDPPELLVDLGPEIELFMGDSVQLEPIASVPALALDTFMWRRPELTEYAPFVSPLETTTYQITIENEFGCKTEDQVVVRVKKDRLVYIPNIFTPNGDGFNDIFTIYVGQGVVSVTKFQVYNRWGEVVYEALNTPGNAVGNTVNFGWDGRFRGEMLNPAVFVYLAEVEFIDGRKELYKGDVSLMR